MQKRAKKWAQMLSKAPKIPQSKIHVEVGRNTNNATENKEKQAIIDKKITNCHPFVILRKKRMTNLYERECIT